MIKYCFFYNCKILFIVYYGKILFIFYYGKILFNFTMINYCLLFTMIKILNNIQILENLPQNLVTKILKLSVDSFQKVSMLLAIYLPPKDVWTSVCHAIRVRL